MAVHRAYCTGFKVRVDSEAWRTWAFRVENLQALRLGIPGRISQRLEESDRAGHARLASGLAALRIHMHVCVCLCVSLCVCVCVCVSVCLCARVHLGLRKRMLRFDFRFAANVDWAKVGCQQMPIRCNATCLG